MKGKQFSLAQLAEEWLLNSCKIFHLPFSSSAYASSLKEAQQFLWAGPEMDPVRFIFCYVVLLRDTHHRCEYLHMNSHANKLGVH